MCSKNDKSRPIQEINVNETINIYTVIIRLRIHYASIKFSKHGKGHNILIGLHKSLLRDLSGALTNAAQGTTRVNKPEQS